MVEGKGVDIKASPESEKLPVSESVRAAAESGKRAANQLAEISRLGRRVEERATSSQAQDTAEKIKAMHRQILVEDQERSTRVGPDGETVDQKLARMKKERAQR